NVSYFAYGSWFAAIKISKAATSVACPWPYPEAKVYDPQGFYENTGAHGPYSVGIWSTWASGEPNGRPHVDPPPPGGRASGSKNGLSPPGPRHWCGPGTGFRIRRPPVSRGVARGRG